MNRKAIIGVAVVVALVLAFLGMACLDGVLVRARLVRMDNEMSATLPLFTVTQRQVSVGLFSSTVQVTYEFNSKLFQGMAAAAAASAKKTALQPELHGMTPPTFTLRHHIQHGPLPGFARFGMARIDSEFVLSEATRLELRKTIGTDEPLKIVTLLGVTGGGTTTLDSPAFTYDDTARQNHIEWGGMHGHLNFSDGMDTLEGELKVPGMHAKGDKGEDMELGAMRLAYDGARAFRLLYVGKASFTVARLAITPAGQTEIMAMQDLSYGVDTSASGDYLDTVAKIDVGAIHAKAFSASDVHYDFSLRHLHGPTYAALTEKLREIYLAASGGDVNAGQRILGPMKEFGATLLEHQPEFVIDRVSVTMPEGSAQLSGRLSLPGFVHADLDAPAMGLMAKLDATLDIAIDEGLLNRDWGPPATAPTPAPAPATAMPPAAARRGAAGRHGPAGKHDAAPPTAKELMMSRLAALEQQGFLTRQDGRLKSHLEFHHGVLTANGRRVGPGGPGSGSGVRP